MRLLRGWLICSLAIALPCFGCSSKSDGRPERVPVTGSITFNEKPLQNAAIAFVPVGSSGPPATGATDSDGSYELMTFETADGAIPGSYNVSIVATGEDPNRNPDGSQKYSEEDPRWTQPKSTIPEHYNDPIKSKLNATVSVDGENEHNFDLK